MKALVIGVLLSASTVCYADHPYCHANYFFKNGYFFFEKCGRYYPVYQYPRFNTLYSQRARWRHYGIWHHEYPNTCLHGRCYPAKDHYRMYTNDGRSVEHFFQ